MASTASPLSRQCVASNSTCWAAANEARQSSDQPWFMQNFSQSLFLPGVLSGRIRTPTDAGAEAFADAADIVAMAGAS